ncbi:MAG: hypothetical protein WA705_29645 [Candidatus Ozemobacteraceae bacterium]
MPIHPDTVMLAIGRETHHRLKVTAAMEKMTMKDFIDKILTFWEESRKKMVNVDSSDPSTLDKSKK